MAVIDVQVGDPTLSSWQGMRRTSLRNLTQTGGRLPGDGAELPLWRPDLLPQLVRGTKENNADTQRVTDVRAALSSALRVDPFAPEDGPARWGMGLKHMVFAIVVIALAVAVGMTIGSVF